MRAYKGLVHNGKITLAEGVDLPDGTVVTVTVGEAELIRAKLRSALKRNVRKRSKGGLRTRGMPTLT